MLAAVRVVSRLMTLPSFVHWTVAGGIPELMAREIVRLVGEIESSVMLYIALAIGVIMLGRTV